jgi:hypothetical protein
MPCVIDYPRVLERMREQGFQCLYHNSGAFGFPAKVTTQSLAWIGPADATIKPGAMALVRSVPPPYAKNLADLAARAWREWLPGRVWAMPKSHWAYELEFGSRDWMPELLESIGMDPALLAPRNNAAAIEFDLTEIEPFRVFVEQLLQNLRGSDFLLAFPGRGTICTIHSHQQLWWTTGSGDIAAGLERMVHHGDTENTEKKEEN